MCTSTRIRTAVESSSTRRTHRRPLCVRTAHRNSKKCDEPNTRGHACAMAGAVRRLPGFYSGPLVPGRGAAICRLQKSAFDSARTRRGRSDDTASSRFSMRSVGQTGQHAVCRGGRHTMRHAAVVGTRARAAVAAADGYIGQRSSAVRPRYKRVAGEIDPC